MEDRTSDAESCDRPLLAGATADPANEPLQEDSQSGPKRCNRCDEDKPLEAYSRGHGTGGRRQPCKDCRNRAKRGDEKTLERARRYREANREKVLETTRRWRKEKPEKAREGKRRYEEANAEEVSERRRRYRETNREQIAERTRQWREENPERVLEQGRQWRRQNYVEVKAIVLRRYGEFCVCCGSTEKLSVDHPNGDGREHRARLGIRGGEPFYRWLLRMYLPPGYQTLCIRCNVSKGRGAHCRLDHSARDGEHDRVAAAAAAGLAVDPVLTSG